MTNDDSLITAVEARDRWGVPLFRIHRWTHRGTLPIRNYRKRDALFLASDIQRLQRAAEQNPLAKPCHV